MTSFQALGQLRHLYKLMLAGHVTDTAAAARGLLGPAIEALELHQRICAVDIDRPSPRR